MVVLKTSGSQVDVLHPWFSRKHAYRLFLVFLRTRRRRAVQTLCGFQAGEIFFRVIILIEHMKDVLFHLTIKGEGGRGHYLFVVIVRTEDDFIKFPSLSFIYSFPTSWSNAQCCRTCRGNLFYKSSSCPLRSQSWWNFLYIYYSTENG
jgi:hypothetical protein